MSEFIRTIIVGGKELRECIETWIADYKVPERIFFTLELPKGATGKIHRLSLKSMVPEFGNERPEIIADTDCRSFWRSGVPSGKESFHYWSHRGDWTFRCEERGKSALRNSAAICGWRSAGAAA